MKLVLNCKANEEGGEIKAAFTPEAPPSDDFQSQARQPVLHHFGFGSLLLVAVYLCV